MAGFAACVGRLAPASSGDAKIGKSGEMRKNGFAVKCYLSSCRVAVTNGREIRNAIARSSMKLPT